ncbi:TIM barrel protein [Desulfolucanica intricata]|uniref:TIM barrel protein n=1 Tax=Desulfolucanica intricata TaxID=1285191 RepID=UPI00083319EA|nr:TIM barrel protein [Desulfolucanica intricata]
MKVRFGAAGNSESFYSQGHKSSHEAPDWLKNLGLDAYEYQCTYGVKIAEATAKKLGQAARECDIALSIHAPYYINLCGTDEVKKVKTKEHILNSMRAAKWMGATTVVFHPGSGFGKEREAALERAKEFLRVILVEAQAEGYNDIKLAPETMGKRGQLGNLKEVLELCSVGEQVVPTIDFGHLHALNAGSLIDLNSFGEVLDIIEDRLGNDALKNLHIHFSPVEFTKAGEKKHWTTLQTQFGPSFEPLAEHIVRRNMTPTVICESSGRQAEDALVYKNIYLKVLKELNG